MKLQEILQEGVFDSIRTERKATDLRSLTQLNQEDLVKLLKTLSDEEYTQIQTKQMSRYIRSGKIFNQLGDQVRDLNREYPDDIEQLYGTNVADGFNRREFQGPENRTTTVQVRAGSEAEKEVNAMRKEYKHYERIRQEASMYTVFRMETARRAKLAKRAANEVAVGSFEEWKQISPNPSTVDMPARLPKSAGVKPSLKNPAAYPRAAAVYTGHPAHYPNWRSDWKRRLLALEDALVRNGKKGFELMYSGKLGSRASYFNFFIIGGDGNLVWRKYQTSSANGMNWLYVNGTQIQTTVFERMSKEKQDEIISRIP